MPKRTYVIKGVKKGAKNFFKIDSTPIWKFAVNKANKAMSEGKYQKITIFSEEEKKTFNLNTKKRLSR